jgi:hypothetical protein
MFTPKISISVPVTSDGFYIADITGTSPADATGYGQGTGLPASNAIWNKKVTAQYLGQAPVELTFLPYTTNEDVAATIPASITDGIYLVTQYFCQEITGLSYTLDAGKVTMTKSDSDQWADPLGIFAGVYGLIYSPGSEAFALADISPIASLSNTSITLSKTLTGASGSSNLWRVYKVSKYVLVIIEGERRLVSDIGDMALNSLHCGGGCNTARNAELMNRLLLKYSAQINMACGNYTKAHNAAVLFNQACTNSNPACTCG